jgi:hypothetical protein
MATSPLADERELAIHPIVATSVQHNTQVRLDSRQLGTRQLISNIGHLQRPKSDSLALRCRSRHTRARVVPGIHLLPDRHIARLGASVRLQNRGETRRILLPAAWRSVARRCVWRIERLRADVDAVLWSCEGVRREGVRHEEMRVIYRQSEDAPNSLKRTTSRRIEFKT